MMRSETTRREERMREGLKSLTFLAVAAIVLAVAAVPAWAECQDSGRIYSVRQCGRTAWFETPPNHGTQGQIITGYWWQLGFGREGASHGVAAAGTGWQAAGLTGDNRFVGNDSGANGFNALDEATGIGLQSASYLPGAPPGSTCFGPTATWSRPGLDGCCDNTRTGVAPLPPPGTRADDILNPYWGRYYGPGVGAPYYTTAYQLDAPMGVILRESIGNNFALAFFATASRGGDSTDVLEGSFDMGAIQNANGANGQPCLGPGCNKIPWQSPPEPILTDPVFEENPPGTRTGNTFFDISWNDVEIYHDGSARPNSDATAPVGTGVGVLDQGQLVRYVIESAPIPGPGPDCGTTWTTFLGPFNSSSDPSLSNVLVPANTCLRLQTYIGKVQAAASPFTQANAANGLLGDQGSSPLSVYGVNQPTGGVNNDPPAAATAKVGDPTGQTDFATTRIVLESARRTGEGITVKFRTVSTDAFALSLTVYGKRGRSQEVQLSTVEPTSLRDGSEIVIRDQDARGIQSIFVVAEPSGTRSNEVQIQADRPSGPDRPQRPTGRTR
jgi:hypothetical protein